MSPTFRALKIRNYRLYATGGVISNVGTWVQRVAQDWLILVLHHGDQAQASIALGVTTGLQFLPVLLLSPYAGLIADRMSKRTLLQFTQVWMAVWSGALALLAITGSAQPWMVYVVAFGFGVGAAFDAPARQAFVSEMVDADTLTNAVGLNSASFNLARVIGPALAGLLIAGLGSGQQATGWVIALNAISYVPVVIALRAMRPAELTAIPRAPRGRGMIRDGFRYVRNQPALLLILITGGFAGCFGLNFQMTSALMATQVYGKGPGEYGILGSTIAIGSLSGALLGARRSSKPRPRLVVLSGATFGVLLIIAGTMPSYLLFACFSPLLGLAALTMLNAANTSIQLSTEPAMRGRVMALYMMIVMGSTPIGSPIIGWIGGAWGPRWTYYAGGGLTLVGVALALAVFRAASRVPVESRACIPATVDS